MPIEFWWWISPMAATGFITMIIFMIVATIVDGIYPSHWVTAVLSFLAVLPWMIAIASTIIWIVTNILILIWRC